MNERRKGTDEKIEEISSIEIFNSVAGSFTAILMQLQAVAEVPAENATVRKECLVRAESLARKGLRQVRELVELNTLAAGSKEGFLKKIRMFVDSAADSIGAASSFQVKGTRRPCNTAVVLALSRIVQEAMSNTQRYSSAKRIEVQLCFEDDRVVLEVKDDGSGFVLDDSLEVGFGLSGMRARVDRLGGGLWIRSSLGSGTAIRVDLPNPYRDYED